MLEAIIFIIILSVLILAHEWGHFIAAKLSGMRVDEFGLGFPPTLLSFKKGETKYTLNLIPFGGFVKIYGEEAEEEGSGIEDPDKNRKFSSRPLIAQAFVMVAGVLFNFILAWLLFSVGFMVGFPSAVTDQTAPYIEESSVIVTSVLPNSPAEEAGLEPGMNILSLSGAGGETIVENPNDVSSFIESAQESFVIKTQFGEEEVQDITITPREGILDGRPAIGITMDEIGTIQLPPHLALWSGIDRTVNLTLLTVQGIWGILSDAVVGEGSFDSVSGPIGIYNLVGEASRLGFAYLIGFTAIISISLGVINLAPFPALDGGRLVLLIVEAVKGSPIKPIVANTINYVGFMVLIALMVLVSYGDLLKLGIF